MTHWTVHIKVDTTVTIEADTKEEALAAASSMQVEYPISDMILDVVPCRSAVSAEHSLPEPATNGEICTEKASIVLKLEETLAGIVSLP